MMNWGLLALGARPTVVMLERVAIWLVPTIMLCETRASNPPVALAWLDISLIVPIDI